MLPRIVCWHLWLERNKRIFQNKEQSPEKIVSKMQALMGEIIKTNQVARNKTKLSPNEMEWMHSFNVSAIDTDLTLKKLEIWEIRLDKSQFGNWLKERKMFKLFFNGASKRNPGMVGGKGVVICPEGKIEVEYSWNIGVDSNNMAKAYGLWQGIKQLKAKGIEEASVFGDS